MLVKPRRCGIAQKHDKTEVGDKKPKATVKQPRPSPISNPRMRPADGDFAFGPGPSPTFYGSRDGGIALLSTEQLEIEIRRIEQRVGVMHKQRGLPKVNAGGAASETGEDAESAARLHALRKELTSRRQTREPREVTAERGLKPKKSPSLLLETELSAATFGDQAKLQSLQALLSDFGHPRVVAAKAQVSHTLVYGAMGDGRLTVFELAGGHKVVSVTQCQRLWPRGAPQGRPRKK